MQGVLFQPTMTKCFQCNLPIESGELISEITGETFHASQIQCAVAIERERCARIAETHPFQRGEEFQDWHDSLVKAIRSGK